MESLKLRGTKFIKESRRLCEGVEAGFDGSSGFADALEVGWGLHYVRFMPELHVSVLPRCTKGGSPGRLAGTGAFQAPHPRTAAALLRSAHQRRGH